MHFQTIVTALFIAGSALAAGVPEPINPDSIHVREAAIEARDASPEAEPEALDKRACKCNKVSNAGLWCGYCYDYGIGDWALKGSSEYDHVYWCNRQGGCEDLGFRKSCANVGGPCDGRDSG